MLTNFFGKSKPITILVILVLFICLFVTAVFSNKIAGNYLEIIFLFLLTLAFVVFIKVKNNLSFDNSYVFLFFVLLTGIFPSVLQTNYFLYSNIILLFFLRKVYSLQSSAKTFKKLFDAGLWLGISFVLEPFSVLFGFLIYLSVYLHQHLNFQKIIIPVIGFITPVFLFFTYCFWFDKTVLFFNLLDWFTYYDFTLYKKLHLLIPIGAISFLVLFSFLVKTPKALSVKNDFRRSWILVLFNFICAVTLIILVKDRNGSELLYLFFPTAIMITNLVEVYENKWYSDVIIAMLMILSFTMCIV